MRRVLERALVEVLEAGTGTDGLHGHRRPHVRRSRPRPRRLSPRELDRDAADRATDRVGRADRPDGILRSMTRDLGPLDRLAERAETLAGAWAARARASTTVGRERALLRMFGVSGLDAAGRPLAWAVVDRYLGGGPGRLGGGIVLPFAMALAEYDLDPQRLALDVASGAVDLGHGGGRSCASRTGGRSPRRRRAASSPPRSSGSTPTGRPGAS